MTVVIKAVHMGPGGSSLQHIEAVRDQSARDQTREAMVLWILMGNQAWVEDQDRPGEFVLVRS
jgi:hypothetical protein